MEFDEFGHSDKNIGYEIQRQKQIKKRFVVNLLELILMKHILKFFQIHKQNE